MPTSANPAASTNYGSNTSLRVDGSPLVRSYLRFDVKGLPAGTVSKATLSVWANSASSVGFSVRKIADNAWQESKLTYTNAPALGSLMLTSTGYNGGVWVNVNVTGYIQGNGVYSLALATGSSTATNLAARESGAHAPKLVVETTLAAVPTAVYSTAPVPVTAAHRPGWAFQHVPASFPDPGRFLLPLVPRSLEPGRLQSLHQLHPHQRLL